MRHHTIRHAFLMAISLFCLAGTTAAQTPADPPARKGPLAGLPSKPGPNVDKIKNLADNSWLELGMPAADPKWGRACGRAWTARMPLAPELHGAYLFGEGVHGFTKPNGHYMDDLWFYDINGHRWICCYPGADAKALDLTIDADGFEATKEAERIPVASMAHGYEMTTYDTDLKRFMSMPNTHGYEKKALPQREKWFKPQPKDASPWLFESESGKWNRLRTGTPTPPSSYGDTLIYLPARKQAFFLHRNENVWLYDVPANKWKPVDVKGPKPPFGIDAVSCYDPKRERIYIGGGSYPTTTANSNALWIFDLKTDCWIDPKPKGAPCKGGTSYPTKNAVLLYDSVNDAVLLVVHSFFDTKKETLGVYVYDPQANSWAEGLAIPDKLGDDKKPKNGFYDPASNAVFVHAASDSRDDGVIWVYRYKRGTN
jgi:hypothetical protein